MILNLKKFQEGMAMGMAGMTLPIARALLPGLYETGTRNLKTSWTDLVSSGVMTISSSGEVKCTDKTIAGDLVFIDDGSILSMNQNAFKNCVELTGITFPKSLQAISGPSSNFAIANGAFMGCTKLSKVIFTSRTITKIGASAFHDCTSLVEIEIPASITEIGVRAFEGCINLVYVKFEGELLTKLPAGMFKDCISLNNIYLPNSITILGDILNGGVFEGCTSLSNIKLPASLTTIGPNAFKGCISIKKMFLPPNVTKIRFDAFSNCSNLETLMLPYGFKEFGSPIDGSIVGGCEKLTSITFPSTTTGIYGLSFEKSYIEKIEVDVNCEAYYSVDGIVYGYATDSYPSHLAVYPPAKVGSEFVVPEGIEVIYYESITDNPNLTKLVFPSTTTKVLNLSIKRLPALEIVEILSTTPPEFYEETFTDCPALAQIIVPVGCGDIYKAATGFEAFVDLIVEADK